MKIIDLLNKIANGEEVPERIRFGHSDYHFNKSNEFYYDDYGNSLYKDMRDATSHLNDKVNILDEEDEFIDIEEIDDTKLGCFINSVDSVLLARINKLIKNQKKIIEKLKEEGK